MNRGHALSIRNAVTVLTTSLLLAAALPAIGQDKPTDVFDRVKHGYAVSDGGVKIHYATLGKGRWS